MTIKYYLYAPGMRMILHPVSTVPSKESEALNPFARSARPRGLRRWLTALALVRAYQRSWLFIPRPGCRASPQGNPGTSWHGLRGSLRFARHLRSVRHYRSASYLRHLWTEPQNFLSCISVTQSLAVNVTFSIYCVAQDIQLSLQ